MSVKDLRRKQDSILKPFFAALLQLLGVSAGKSIGAQQYGLLVRALTQQTNVARGKAADNAWAEYLRARPGSSEGLSQPSIPELPESYTRKVLDTYRKDLESPTAYVGAAGRIAQSQARMVENAAREQTIAAARVDDECEGWARVPVGETCGWCLMLCSRGAVYKSKKSASERKNGGATGSYDEYHLNCNCAVVPKFRGKRYEGEDHADELYDLWADATKGKSGKAALEAFSEFVNGGGADHAKDVRKKVGKKTIDNTKQDNEPRRAQLNALIKSLSKSFAELEKNEGTAKENTEALRYQRRELARLRKELSELN